jgi:hypothetical protein
MIVSVNVLVGLKS